MRVRPFLHRALLRRRVGMLVAGMLVTAIGAQTETAVTASTHIPSAAPKPAISAPPAASYSYYVYSSYISQCNGTQTWSCPLWTMGATASVPSGGALVILDFGAPCQDPATGQLGVQMFWVHTCTSNSVIQPLFAKWIAGYEATHGAGTPPSIIAAGVSNSVNGVPGDPITGTLGDVRTIQTMAALGDAWERQVVGATSTVGLAAPLTVWGAIDAEQSGGGSWLGPQPTRAFVDAYGAAMGRSSGSFACNTATSGMLADFGDAVYLEPGFYSAYPGSWNPPGGWTADDIYHVAWGAPVACAVPEIYYDINAAEWASLSDYAVKHGSPPITFTAAMSEYGADPNTLTAAQSWTSLALWTGQNVPYVTDIAWSMATIPAQLNALAPTQSTTEFPVTWQTASGISGATYTLYSSDNAGPWLTWANVAGSTATFFGVAGHHYDFFIQTIGSGYSNGSPGSSGAGTTVSPTATDSEPFVGLYAVDAYGGLHPASSPPLQTPSTWPGQKLVRGMALAASGLGGYTLDSFGGLHPFGNAQWVPSTSYWPGWDIARGIALNAAGTGGYVLDGFGGLHPFGNAPWVASSSYWPGWDIATGVTLLQSAPSAGYVVDGWGGFHPFGGAPEVTTNLYTPGQNIVRGVGAA